MLSVPESRENAHGAVVAMTLSACLVPISGALVRYCSDALRIVDILAFSLLLPSIVTLAFLGRRIGGMTAKVQGLVILRALFCLGSILATFWAARTIDFSTVYFVNMLAPIAASAVAWWLLTERPTLVRALGAAIACVGAALALTPSLTVSATAALALPAAFASATAMILCTRALAHYAEDSPALVALSMCYVGLLAGLLAARDVVWPSAADALPLLGIGATTFAAVVLVACAYSLTPISFVATFEFLKVAGSVVLGAVLFEEPLTPIVVTGLALILSSNLIVARLEVQGTRKDRRKATAHFQDRTPLNRPQLSGGDLVQLNGVVSSPSRERRLLKVGSD